MTIDNKLIFGRFEIVEKIGEGSTGKVFRVFDQALQTEFALKTFHEEVTRRIGVERFRRLFYLIARLDHPSIVPLAETGIAGDSLWLTMKYLKGSSLENLRETYPPKKLAEILLEISRGLEFIHAHGVYHLDLKPSNIFINEDGVKLIDFGLSRKQNNMVCGTPAYMAPEIIKSEHFDGRADLYSCGVLAYEMLTGKNPFIGENNTKTIQNQLKFFPEKIEIGPRYEKLTELIQNLLEKDPKNRPPTARSMRIQLESILDIPRTPGELIFLPDGPFVNREKETEQLTDKWDSLKSPILYNVKGESGVGVTAFCRNILLKIESMGGKTISMNSSINPIAQLITPYRDSAFTIILRKHLPQILPAIEHAVDSKFLEHLDIQPVAPPENYSDLMFAVADMMEELTADYPLLINFTDEFDETLWRALEKSSARILALAERVNIGENIVLENVSQDAYKEYVSGLFGKVKNIRNMMSKLFKRKSSFREVRENLREYVLKSALVPLEDKWEFRKEYIQDGISFSRKWNTLPDMSRYMAALVAICGQIDSMDLESMLEADYFYASYKLLSDGLVDETEIGNKLYYRPSRELSKNIEKVLSAREIQRYNRYLGSHYCDFEKSPQKKFLAAYHYEKAGMEQEAYNYYAEAGKYYLKRCDYPSAAKAFTNADKLLHVVEDSADSIRTLKRLAMSHKYLGDFDKARKAYYRALSVAQGEEDKSQEASIVSDIGVTYFEEGNIPRAIEHYKKATDLHGQIGSERGVLIDTVNLAGAYQVEEDFERARKLFKKASKEAEKQEHKLTQCVISLNMGQMDFNSGSLDSSLKNFLKSAYLAREIGYDQFLFESILGLAATHRKQGKAKLARKALNESAEIAIRIGHRAEAKIVLERMAQGRVFGDHNALITSMNEAESLEKYMGGEEIAMLAEQKVLCMAASLIEFTEIEFRTERPDNVAIKGLYRSLRLLKEGENLNLISDILSECIRDTERINSEELTAEIGIAMAKGLSCSGKNGLDILDQTRNNLELENPYSMGRIELTRAELLKQRGETVGVLSALAEARDFFSELENNYQLDLLNNIEKTISPETRESKSDFKRLLPVIKALNSVLDQGELFTKIMDAFMQIGRAERGLLFIMEKNNPVLALARSASGRDLNIDDVRFSNSLLREVIKTKEARFSEDLTSDDSLSARESVIDLELTMGFCVPIKNPNDDIKGLVYADSRIGSGDFNQETLTLLSALADQAAVALRNAERFDALRAEKERLSGAYNKRFGGEEIIGESKAMQDLRAKLSAVAEQEISLLITGETGTGKDLVARNIHLESKRKSGPFIAINCAAIPENLLESELLGHEKGAFTGAEKLKIGKFEQADGGTIFLDEIAEMPVNLQSKLLRVLENKKFMRLGGNKEISVDVRTIAATNIDPDRAISEGKLRSDLYYRIAPVRINIPPLRDRNSDIPALAGHFMTLASHKFDREINSISNRALRALQTYSWPGNIRELISVIEETVIFAKHDMIGRDDLPLKILKEDKVLSIDENLPQNLEMLKNRKKEMAERLEEATIRELLESNDWNVTEASKSFGINRSRLHQLMNKYGVVRK